MGSIGPMEVDALIVGAGFAGIYQLYSLLKLGLTCKLVDMGSNVGGTWFWNRYPGAMSDTESYIYRFSWDKEDLTTYPWTHHYLKQPEIFKYLQHVVDKHDLRKYMQLETELLDATFDEDKNIWRVRLSGGETVSARYLVTALGLLSRVNYPDISRIDSFSGEKYHTAKFPETWDFSEKRVGVIGCGSTGVQVMTELGKPGNTKSLTSFQRHPQYSVPSGDKPVSKEYREKVNETYDEIWHGVMHSRMGFGFQETNVPTFSVSPEEREQIYQEAWDRGGGFRFMFKTFSDIAVSEEANSIAANFIRRQIARIVSDPEKCRKLTPHDYYARRPICDGGYYEVFNNENVDIVDLRDTPITEISTKGIRTSDGKEHELDVLIFATGFDAVDGNYMRINIRGRGGESLQDHWNSSPSSYLGVSVPNFPNLFMITGPYSPFSNITPAIETHVDFVTEAIKYCESHSQKNVTLEATNEAEKEWVESCEKMGADTLFSKTESWISGANIKGKKRGIAFYLGGLEMYRAKLEEIIENKWLGFRVNT